MTLLAGLAACILLWWIVKAYSKADPAALARRFKTIGGIALLAFALVMGTRGRIDVALLMGGVGAWLIGWGGKPDWMPRRARRMRTATLSFTIDQPSGAIDGQVLAGPYAGRALGSMAPGELMSLLQGCRGTDPQGAALLEAYLDGRFAGWRQNADTDADAGRSGGFRGRASPGGLTEEEAYEVLGLRPGASLEDVRLAHRALIKKLHPDQGGTNDLASRVNLAKDVLARRHR